MKTGLQTKAARICSLVLIALLLLALLPTLAQADDEIRCYAETTWSVTNSGNTFTVTRSGDLTRTETVYYRTVSLTAVEGQHFTKKTGTLTFGPNENSKSVTVTESNNPTGAYQYQVGATRTYRFEVCDPGGFTLASVDRTITKGTSVSESALRWISVNVAAGPITVTDDGYAQGYISVPINNFFSQAPKAYLQMIGIYEIRMFVDFEAAEKDDGYQYIQIYVNDTTNVDTGAGSGDPGTVSNSVYAAGFGHKPGSTYSTFENYRFPVASVGNGSGADTPWTDRSNTVGKLYMQSFYASRRAEDGYLRVCKENTTNLNPLAQLSTVGIRLNASGDLNDTWYAKNIKANFKAIDITKPLPVTSQIVVAPGPGLGGNYRTDNYVYVTVPFNEIVVSQGNPWLETSWGKLWYEAGLGTNVLTFKGKAPKGSSNGTNILIVKGITENSVAINDLAGNELSVKIQGEANTITPVADYSYTVEYEFGGGESPSGQVTSYTYNSDAFTLKEPYRLGYDFTGWTGTNGSTPQTTVTVAKGSHGDRRYVANWSEAFIWGMNDGANGSAERPYLIRTPEELIALRDWVNRGSDFDGTYFKLCNDLNMTDITFDTIGYAGKPFRGNFDGCGYTISHLNASLGLFGRIENGAVSNLTLDHAAVYKTGGSVGALVGYAKNAVISNCVVKDSTVGSNSSYVGGFVGNAETTTIDNCVVANTTVGNNSSYVGGFIGNYSGPTISDCVVADSVVSGTNYVGGFCGYQSSSSGSVDCFVLRTSVTATGSNNIGAVIGYCYGLFNPYNYNCTVNGNAPTGNTAKYTVYTVTAGEHITVSGTVNKTYENVDYYKKNNEITLTYTGVIPAGFELAYTVNGTRIEGNTFHITSDAAVSVTWRKLLTNSDIKITVPAQIATGSALTPEITVKDDETTLEAGTDYTVGDWSGALIEPGVYTATLTGVGNYAGTATATFKIKAPGSDIVRVDGVDYDDLDEAIAAWWDGTTMTLLTDVTLAAGTTLYVDLQNGNYMLDLNGHKLIGADGMPTVEVRNGSLTLLDSIGGGTITHAEGATGCGVFVIGGNGHKSYFTMESGTISGNVGEGNYGGGVYVYDSNATFTMNGGSITGNRGEGYNGGGGVRIYKGKFIMNGGSITGNSATKPYDSCDGNGGGVNIDINGGSFQMYGGSITGNTAAGLGGGVYTTKDITFSGDVTVTGNRSGVAAVGTGGRMDNVYLFRRITTSPQISVPSSKPLDAAARIGVTRSEGAGVFSGNLTGRATAENFTSDDENYAVVMNDSGKMELRRAYAVRIAESAAGAVTASVGGQPVTRALEGATVTLTVTPDSGYELETLTVTDENDNEVEVTDNTFAMPASNVTVTATFKETTATPSFKSHSVVLSGQIGLNFFADLSTLSEAEKASGYVTFSIPHGDCTARDNYDANDRSQTGGYYGFTCYVSSIQMAEMITATFHYTENGEEKTIRNTYSIKQYVGEYNTAVANHTIETDETTVALVHALADYGHYVQIFLAAARHWTIGTDFTKMDLHFAESYDIAAVQTAVQGYAIVKTIENNSDIQAADITYSLVLDSETAIKVYFAYSGTPTITVDGDAYTATAAGGKYVVRIPNISAHELTETHTIVFTTANGTATVEVSALSYVKGALDYYSDAEAQNAMAALYAYSAAAQAYKTAHTQGEGE